MPGSPTTPGHMSARASAPIRIAFHTCDSVGPRNTSFAAQWLAYALPYRRFARTLAGACARLGADAVRYSFTVVDFHHLLLAGFTGAPHARVEDHAGPSGRSRFSAPVRVAFRSCNGVGTRICCFIAVGTRIAPRPPHRSERALLTHSVLTLSV
jgi:hypothetical protein